MCIFIFGRPNILTGVDLQYCSLALVAHSGHAETETETETETAAAAEQTVVVVAVAAAADVVVVVVVEVVVHGHRQYKLYLTAPAVLLVFSDSHSFSKNSKDY